jgi:hypothetical protein
MSDEMDWGDGDDARGDEVDFHPLMLSATDLLVAWAPNETQSAPEAARRAWDRYFDPVPSPAASQAVEMAAESLQDETWDAAAAELVVDALYRFIHALERFDIKEAMECIAPDYHTIEHDLEVDRDGLRLRLESSLDHWRGENVRVTLAEIPDPVFHPSGVLIPVVVQVDFWSALQARRMTELLRRVFWFRAQPDGRWLIGGMAETV